MSKDINYPDANAYGARQNGPVSNSMRPDRGSQNDTRRFDNLPDLVHGGYQAEPNERRDNVVIIEETPKGVIIEGQYNVRE
jgi:hypothetical protein